jgi:ubiquinone/menaquinone biosynthesis C-methylase UbiE
MNEKAARFTGTIPENYELGLEPVLFQGWPEDVSRRVALLKPNNVLDTASNTGIVTRALRDVLPAEYKLIATDSNLPILGLAKQKLEPEEEGVFEKADAMDLCYQSEYFDLVIMSI